MCRKDVFIITTEVTVIYPYYDTCGRLQSMIMEGDQLHLVNRKPIDVVDTNLRRGGSSLRGASEAAKELLGSTSMAPVAISKIHGIYMIPTVSPKDPDCIWVAVGQVKDYEYSSPNHVLVHFHNGSSICLPISESRFKSRLHRAYSLQSSLENNRRHVMVVRETYTQTYVIKRKNRNRNFDNE